VTTVYRGRFAPSPTGNVHFGTLVAAVASYLQAITQQGVWHLRIDDIDTTRTIKHADTHIIKTLEDYGFEWHGEIYYQSKNIALYEEALTQLIDQSLVFPCLCSRKLLAEQSQLMSNDIYPGTCRKRHLPELAEHSLRVRGINQNITFNDKVMGEQRQNIQTDCGDFIIKRRDGLFAYQLAVVIDDEIQGITEVVRGVDLLDSTARQVYLQQLLDYHHPNYLHLPLATDANGDKLSKSTPTASIEYISLSKNLVHALQFLGQKPATELEQSEISEIWTWAIQHWNIETIPNEKTITIKQFPNS